MHNFNKSLNHVQRFEERFKQNTISDYDTTGVKCKTCYDCGYAFVNADGGNFWVFCDCFEGKSKSEIIGYDLPRLDHEMKRLFKILPFPIAHFIPSSFDSRTFTNKLNSATREFKQYLKDSVKFWRG